jgi:DNA-binding transcriptional regulator GbsR (MarR family)
MFVSVLLYALEHAHLLKYCQNPGCREPYFIAERVSQNVCSVACAKPIQREAKRRWWQEHGEEWRRKRNAAASGKKLQRKRKGGKG